MLLSVEGLHHLTQLEGSRAQAYADSGGAMTIGVGHKMTVDERSSGKIFIRGVRVRWVGGLSEAQIEDLLLQDLMPVESAVTTVVRVPLTQNQFDTLVIFTFNCGREAFAHSTMLKLLNAGDYEGVPKQLRRWVRDGDLVVPGLVARREAEVSRWLA